MDVGQDKVEYYEKMIWDTLNSVSDEKSSDGKSKDELRILQNELMEASEWMNLSMTE